MTDNDLIGPISWDTGKKRFLPKPEPSGRMVPLYAVPLYGVIRKEEI